ncbi:10079_t:CDS:2, partial [Cetraspora pellucida]
CPSKSSLKNKQIAESSTFRQKTTLVKAKQNENKSTSQEDILKILEDMQNNDKESLIPSLRENHDYFDDFLSGDLQEQNIDQMQEIDQIKEVDQMLATFNNMNDVLEVCNWLIKHPHILKLASQMHTVSLLPVTHASEFGEPSNSLAMSSANTIDNRKHKIILIIDLIYVNSPSTCIDEFIKRIFGYSPYSNEGKEIETRTKKALGDFHHKLNLSVVELIDNFKKTQEREGITITSLSNEDIKKFIDENVILNLLK